jgi:hypothetical protein
LLAFCAGHNPALIGFTIGTVGSSPTTLYLIVENVDRVVAKAVKLGAKPLGPAICVAMYQV